MVVAVLWSWLFQVICLSVVAVSCSTTSTSAAVTSVTSDTGNTVTVTAADHGHHHLHLQLRLFRVTGQLRTKPPEWVSIILTNISPSYLQITLHFVFLYYSAYILILFTILCEYVTLVYMDLTLAHLYYDYLANVVQLNWDTTLRKQKW